MRRSALALAVAWLASSGLAAQGAFERGVEAYRRGNHAEAREHWRAALGEDLDPLERARVYYDLGNAAWRLGQELEACACYGAAVRLDPRHRDAWKNLEFARAEAGLPPADPGDLGATLELLLTSLRPAEERLLALGALCAWVLLLVLELRFGGTLLRRALYLGLAVLLLCAAPFGQRLLRPEARAPAFAIQNGVTLRSEPLETSTAVGELAPLEEVERLDALPGWVRVERGDGSRGWVREPALLPLVLKKPDGP